MPQFSSWLYVPWTVLEALGRHFFQSHLENCGIMDRSIEWSRGVQSGQFLVAGTSVIRHTSCVKNCSLGFILKPWWFHFNIAVSDSFWNRTGINVRVKNYSLHLHFHREWNHCSFKMNSRLQYYWNHCGFKMNLRLQLSPAIWQLKNGLMALPVSFLVPGNGVVLPWRENRRWWWPRDLCPRAPGRAALSGPSLILTRREGTSGCFRGRATTWWLTELYRTRL